MVNRVGTGSVLEVKVVWSDRADAKGRLYTNEMGYYVLGKPANSGGTISKVPSGQKDICKTNHQRNGAMVCVKAKPEAYGSRNCICRQNKIAVRHIFQHLCTLEFNKN